jgi:hypothetical protein
VLPESLIKRIDRAGGQQSKGARCILCTEPWEYCSHSRRDVDTVLDAYHRAKDLKRILKGVR